ncbi:uncharacterized protein LOC118144078 [Callithrix jacchus]|uniref:small proline-rich protein 2H-like n=1 Tax=Callithrix jacchus TaxID=9483 RepID=UPI00159D3E01|nr:small proline-rich protein 2H-like [Callithrix jacchus]
MTISFLSLLQPYRTGLVHWQSIRITVESCGRQIPKTPQPCRSQKHTSPADPENTPALPIPKTPQPCRSRKHPSPADPENTPALPIPKTPQPCGSRKHPSPADPENTPALQIPR